MSTDTVIHLLKRVYSHCRRHGIEDFTIVFHGGEPLLAPPSFYTHFVETAKQVCQGNVRWHFSLQTNGIRIDDEWCALFERLEIGIGISLDGPKATNDLYRKDHMGRGSFDQVIKGWNKAVRSGLKPGLLCVIDVQSDPLEIYNLMRGLGAREMDFLFPDATHDIPPPAYMSEAASTPYADWLLTIFKAWTNHDDPSIRIRIFTGIMEGILGRANGLDNLGTGKTEVLVVESDGEFQSSDVLRMCMPNKIKTDVNVATHEIDDAFNDELVQLYYSAHERLCGSCMQCKIRNVCGGGFLPHRYSASNRFDNPSVYCRDLTKLIAGVGDWFVYQIPSHLRQELGIERNYQAS